jgi:SpoVK/Ycf46/Vps4 family AAA+-type ATPase
VDILELAKQTDGFSGAETVQVIQTACLLAMKHDIIEIENEYFIDAIKSITKRITPEMIEFYQEFQQKSGLRSV